MLCGGGRDMAAEEIRAIAAPATTAIIRSAERRSPTLNGMRCSGHIWGTRLGSQRRPRRSSTVVTISTSNCVTPRSGAESQTKLMQVARQIGRAHVCTPVTNAQLVFRLLLEK